MDAKKSVGFLLAVAAAALLASCASNQPSQTSSTGAHSVGTTQSSHNSCGKNSCGGTNGCGASH